MLFEKPERGVIQVATKPRDTIGRCSGGQRNRRARPPIVQIRKALTQQYLGRVHAKANGKRMNLLPVLRAEEWLEFLPPLHGARVLSASLLVRQIESPPHVLVEQLADRFPQLLGIRAAQLGWGALNLDSGNAGGSAWIRGLARKVYSVSDYEGRLCSGLAAEPGIENA